MDHVIPPVILGPRGTGLVPRSTLKKSARDIGPQQVTVAGVGAAIPLAYGRVRVGAMVTQPVAYQNTIVVPCVVGLGPIQGFEVVHFDDDDVPLSVVGHFYTGAAGQGIDSFLAAAWALAHKTYADTLPGIAYAVLRIPVAIDVSLENISFIIQGFKVYDPRDGTQTQGVKTTYKYSTNPALHLAHFLSEPGIGPEEVLDWTSVADASDVNDQLCGSGAQQEKRRECGIYFDSAQEVGQIEEELRAHAGCWVIREGGIARLIPDAPASSIFHFTTGKYRVDSVTLSKRGFETAPTVVSVEWTDTRVDPWKTAESDPLKAVGVDAGTVPWVDSKVPMRGIQKPGQAYREAVRRRNEFDLCDLSVGFIAMDEGAKVMKGAVFQLTDTEGLSGKLFRCTDAYPIELGRWKIAGTEYNDAVYSDSPAVGPTDPDTDLPDPTIIAAPTLMVITERIYSEKDIAADSLARGLIYQSRLEVSVTPPDHFYPVVFDWEAWDGSVKVNESTTATPFYATPAVQQGHTYRIDCYARNTTGARSPVLSRSQAALGKLLPPGPIPGMLRTLEIGGEALWEWSPAIDIDVMRYEWRYTPNQTTGGSWEVGVLIDRVDGFRMRVRGLPVGTHRFYGKAIDSVGNYSTSAIFFDLTITTDADAFLQDHEFTSPTLTNMAAYPPVEGVWKQRWATSFAADQWNSVIPNPVNSGGNPVLSYHASGTSSFESEVWDLGAPIVGDWQLIPNTTALTGAATYAIMTSLDGSSWTTNAGISFKGVARYVKALISTATTGTLLIDAPPKITIAAITRSETGGPVTSNAGSAKTITLSNHYVKLSGPIVIMPRGTAARSFTVANIVLHPTNPNTFDVYLWNGTTQVADDFDWRADGVTY